MVRTIKPKKVLELGTGEGGSALFMLLGLPADGTLITVERRSVPPQYLKHCLTDPRLKVVTGDANDLTIYQGLDLMGLDLLFMDSTTKYFQVKREWQLYEPFLKADAPVVIDDIHLNRDMELFWGELAAVKVDTAGVLHWSGLGIAQP
jgi:predicted O-methyltransferase YrrM